MGCAPGDSRSARRFGRDGSEMGWEPRGGFARKTRNVQPAFALDGLRRGERSRFNVQRPTASNLGRISLLDRLRKRRERFLVRRTHTETLFVQQSFWRVPG